MRGRWFVCLLAMGCSGGVGGSDGDPNLGGGQSTSTTDADADASSTSTPTGASSPSGTSTPTGVDTTDPGASSTTSTTTADSTGQPACDDHWRVQPVNTELTDIAYDAASDTVYAVGNDDGGTPWAASLDGCNGDTLSLSNIAQAGATTTYVRRVLSSDEGLYVAGSVVVDPDPGNGMYARLDPTTLTPLWSQPLLGGSGTIDEVLQLTLSNASAVWMAGTAGLDVMPTPWTINGSTDGAACGFGGGTPGPGSARALAAQGDTVVVAMRPSEPPGGLVLLGYDQGCTCMCAPQWTSPTIAIGAGDTSVGDMVAVDGQFYVVGWAHDGVGVDLYGYVAWLDGNGTLLGTYTDDVTPTGEGFLTATAVGGTLYVGGGQAWDGQPGFDSANARLHALPIPFGGTPSPTWTALPQALDIVQGIDASTDAVFVGGTADGIATVLRCDADGTCG